MAAKLPTTAVVVVRGHTGLYTNCIATQELVCHIWMTSPIPEEVRVRVAEMLGVRDADRQR